MPHTTTSSIPVRTAIACLALLGASQTMAQTTITGQITDYVSEQGYAATIENLTFSQGGSAYGGSGVVICIDAFRDFPSVPSTRTYDVVTAADVVNAPAYANRAEALIDWVVDRYYTSFVSNTVNGYDFNQVLWEITADFDGTRTSLNSTAGNIYTTAPGDYATMMSSLLAAYSSIPDSYRSTQYATTFLSDRNPDYQDMVLITAVPEPSTYVMMFAGIGALLAWRRRSAR